MTILVAVFSPSAAWTMPAQHVEALRRNFPQHTFVEAWDRESLRRALPSADVAFSAYLDRDLVPSLTELRWVQIPAAGVAHVMSREVTESPIVVTSARGIRARAIAEHVMAVALALARQLPAAFRYQAERHWALDEIDGSGAIRTLHGKRMGIVGLGSIGTEVARLALAFGMHVSATRRRADQPVPDVGGVGADGSPIEVMAADRLHALMAKSDVIVLTAASVPHAPPLVNEGALKQVRPGALFVNVSRGRLVDEPALLGALKEGRLGGAALDVFRDEPLDPLSPFWALPNVIVTPHVAGTMEDYWTPLVELFSENLRRFSTGAPLLNVVDKEAGY